MPDTPEYEPDEMHARIIRAARAVVYEMEQGTGDPTAELAELSAAHIDPLAAAIGDLPDCDPAAGAPPSGWYISRAAVLAILRREPHDA
jgi:hypothetical protein